MRCAWFIGLCAAILLPAYSAGADRFESTVSGSEESVPAGYVPPMVSNGSLCMLIDYQGGQSQRSYVKMTPGIWWEGRRYGPAHDEMVPLGHFEQELSVAGRVWKTPTRWTQTLNTREAVVTCRNGYDDALTVETIVFVPLAHDLIAVKKRISAGDPKVRSVRLTFKYQFTAPGNDNRVPRRTVCSSELSVEPGGVDFLYHVDGYRPLDGIISVFSDKPAVAAVDRQVATLSADVPLDTGPFEMTFYLLLADSLDGDDYRDRAAQLKARARQEGFDRLLASHRQEWGKYWDESYVRIPDGPLEKAYATAQYHLRASATRWSFPVGIFPTHWAGRFFGWDEMFCYQALVSSNHGDIARRCPEFRLAGLPKALSRASHYGKPGIYGARFPWESLEDGTEGAPPGFWMDHVFHMSNIAVSAWFQYLYTDDREYLKNTGYPVIKECARFFLANMIYEGSDGGMFVGKCTDLERLGPARQNPFMTSCGAIYTLEAAAEAARLLETDDTEAANWEHAAAKLRQSLPHDGERYVPYAGCQEESVASLGGLFPYPLFDETDVRQRNAVYHFVANGKASGNMYPVGQSLCAWYAGWMAAALAALGDRTEPVKLLDKAAEGAGCFGEMFEINEPQVSMHPWFATASGNVVYALNQILVQSRGDRILIAPAVPDSWEDYSFKLACHGNLVVTVAVRGGRLERLVLTPADSGVERIRTLVIPERLIDTDSIRPGAIRSMTTQDGCCRMTVGFERELALVGTAQEGGTEPDDKGNEGKATR